MKLIWADAGYSGPEFAHWVEKRHGVKVEIVSKIAATGFEVLPRRAPFGQGLSSGLLAGGTNGGGSAKIMSRIPEAVKLGFTSS